MTGLFDRLATRSLAEQKPAIRMRPSARFETPSGGPTPTTTSATSMRLALMTPDGDRPEHAVWEEETDAESARVPERTAPSRPASAADAASSATHQPPEPTSTPAPARAFSRPEPSDQDPTRQPSVAAQCTASAAATMPDSGPLPSASLPLESAAPPQPPEPTPIPATTPRRLERSDQDPTQQPAAEVHVASAGAAMSREEPVSARLLKLPLVAAATAHPSKPTSSDPEHGSPPVSHRPRRTPAVPESDQHVATSEPGRERLPSFRSAQPVTPPPPSDTVADLSDAALTGQVLAALRRAGVIDPAAEVAVAAPGTPTPTPEPGGTAIGMDHPQRRTRGPEVHIHIGRVEVLTAPEQPPAGARRHVADAAAERADARPVSDRRTTDHRDYLARQATRSRT